jgi:hypothetical protein
VCCSRGACEKELSRRGRTSGRSCRSPTKSFNPLLEQVRDLHRLADEVTREKTRIDENVRARLSWDRNPPVLPAEQRKLADEVVEVLAKPRLSWSQSRQLQRAFFGRYVY